MNKHRDFVCRTHNNERGQVVPLVGVMMVGMLGLTAMSVDVGSAYFSYNQLQAATNAAALAGAYGLPDTSAATTEATSLSAVTGNNNAQSNLPNVTMVSGYPQYYCASSVSVTCIGTTPVNAIVVKQQVTIPTYFARVFGKNSVTLTTTATAAMRGSTASPYNVALVLDTTGSMSSNLDTSCGSGMYRIDCALKGTQVLLKTLSPCRAGLSSCGTVTSGNVANPVDRVSLFVFPPVTTTSASNDYDCSGAPVPVAYATPFPATSTYQIVPFSSDYRSNDTTTTLTSSSNLVAAAGGKTSCTGAQAIGGMGTYYPQAIYAAQAALVSAKASNPGSQNVLIILGDGDASSNCSSSSGGVCTGGPMIGASTTSGTYPSSKNQCHQAITAAQAATAAGTRVYSVAYYGSGSVPSGCSTDTSPGITACQTMEQMASAAQDFYSDSSSCHISGSQPTTSLNTIFSSIAGDLTVARLIPNGTT